MDAASFSSSVLICNLLHIIICVWATSQQQNFCPVEVDDLLSHYFSFKQEISNKLRPFFRYLKDIMSEIVII